MERVFDFQTAIGEECLLLELFIWGEPFPFKFHWEISDKRFEEGTNERFSGHWMSFYPDGTKQADGFYQNGVRDGLFQLWSQQGGLIGEIPYLGGKLNGTLKFWDTKTNEELLSCEFYDNEKSGFYRERVIYSDGRVVLKEGFYQSNSQEGLWRSYYLDGQLAMEQFYQNDARIGIEKSWYPNGQLESEGKMHPTEDRAVGFWREWHPNGRLKMEADFGGNGGVLAKKWYDDGSVEREFYPGAGCFNLPDRWFYRNGKLKSEEILWKNNTVIYRKFYESGKLKKEGHYTKGNQQGRRWKYLESGDLEQEDLHLVPFTIKLTLMSI